jgi:BirA family biotin operon repressor/biotin-[acetyl-CoA-carboxylase] ligase
VNQTEFRSDAPNPVSIAQLTGKEMDRDEVLNAFLEELSKQCENRNIHRDYLRKMYRRDGMYPFETEGTRFMARVAGVNDDGRLMLEDENGIAHLFRFKEVVFVIEH